MRTVVDRALVTGWLLLAVSLPLGLTLEALHALKVQVYLGSELRRELWTLAHAHGNLLGILCLVFAALGPRVSADPARRRRLANLLALGAMLMPVGFLLGGILNSEGDPSLGILLVPVGGLVLLVALLGSAIAAFAPRAGDRRGDTDGGDAGAD
ncbi:MAG: hypothetical protein KDE27_24910 [Planctomycetes bacterium]|nr:hypothetical protein [Planctomycetota bacterium]